MDSDEKALNQAASSNHLSTRLHLWLGPGSARAVHSCVKMLQGDPVLLVQVKTPRLSTRLQGLGRGAHALGVEVGHAHCLCQALLPAVAEPLQEGVVAEEVGAERLQARRTLQSEYRLQEWRFPASPFPPAAATHSRCHPSAASHTKPAVPCAAFQQAAHPQRHPRHLKLVATTLTGQCWM